MEHPTLIVGCGYVGTELGLNLANSGGVVLGMRRDPSALPPAIRRVAADLASPGALPEVPELGALVFCPSAGARTEEAYRRAYVDGVTRVREALGGRASALARAVYVSSTAVYGDAGGGDVDESTPAAPRVFTGSILLEGEARFREAFPNATVIRLAGIYGPGRTRMARQVLSGGPFESSAETIGNRIHRDDCAGAIAHLLALPQVAELYVGVDDGAVPLGEVRAFIASLFGRDGRPFEPKGPPEGKRMRAPRLAASGYVLRVPTFREGYPAIVQELGPS